MLMNSNLYMSLMSRAGAMAKLMPGWPELDSGEEAAIPDSQVAGGHMHHLTFDLLQMVSTWFQHGFNMVLQCDQVIRTTVSSRPVKNSKLSRVTRFKSALHLDTDRRI